MHDDVHLTVIQGAKDDLASLRPLDTIANEIHTLLLDERRQGRELWKTRFQIGRALLDARTQFPSDRLFGEWRKAQGFERDRNTLHRLRVIAEREPVARDVLLSAAADSGRKRRVPMGIDALYGAVVFGVPEAPRKRAVIAKGTGRVTPGAVTTRTPGDAVWVSVPYNDVARKQARQIAQARGDKREKATRALVKKTARDRCVSLLQQAQVFFGTAPEDWVWELQGRELDEFRRVVASVPDWYRRAGSVVRARVQSLDGAEDASDGGESDEAVAAAGDGDEAVAAADEAAEILGSGVRGPIEDGCDERAPDADCDKVAKAHEVPDDAAEGEHPSSRTEEAERIGRNEPGHGGPA